MSLRVWLPLNGDLHNQGLSNITFSTTTVNWNAAGKIGQAFSTLNSNVIGTCPNLNGVTTFSLTFWCFPKTNSSITTNWCNIIALGSKSADNSTSAEFRFESSYGNTYILSHHNNIGDPIGGGTASLVSERDKWYHVAVIVNNESHTIRYYVNGVQLTTSSFLKTHNGGHLDGTIKLANENIDPDCLLNDVRIYDHALSELEIKEIAHAKVLHYPLCENLGSGLNLIKNGFGELGTDNWTSKTMFSNDVPEDQPEIKQSIYGNSTIEYIPFWHNCTYRVSLWVKSTASSGYSYPSFIPYDIDKNQIQVRHTKYGFNMSTMTTLAQPLNPGDTKIYVTDLSKWNDASGHYYNYAAIFGYADSTGYIYQDGIYTRNIPAFGSGTTAKTNLDKTNNIINLNNAYSGPAIPAGRSICASCDGSTYFYPLGAIANTSIQDWTYKTATFTSNASYLVAARFLRFINIYNTTYCAGIKLVNESTIKTNNIIYDISGYCNNGTIIGDLETSTPSPRYSCATKFDGSSAIKVNDNNWMAQGASDLTVNIWAYMDNWSNWNGHRLYSCTEGGGFNIENTIANSLTFPVCVYTNTAHSATGYIPTESRVAILKTDLTSGWHMLTYIYTETECQCYLDGVLYQTKPYTSYGVYFNINGSRLFLGCEANGVNAYSPYFIGQESDFRIYYTALSAQDVLNLYNNSTLSVSS